MTKLVWPLPQRTQLEVPPAPLDRLSCRTLQLKGGPSRRRIDCENGKGPAWGKRGLSTETRWFGGTTLWVMSSNLLGDKSLRTTCESMHVNE
jgi:hypothetical protein